jgi:uncharacterized alkaline shock family protein YloU
MDNYLKFFIHNGHKISDYRLIPEVRKKLQDKIMFEVVCLSGLYINDIDVEIEKTLTYAEKHLRVGRK